MNGLNRILGVVLLWLLLKLICFLLVGCLSCVFGLVVMLFRCLAVLLSGLGERWVCLRCLFWIPSWLLWWFDGFGLICFVFSLL